MNEYLLSNPLFWRGDFE